MSEREAFKTNEQKGFHILISLIEIWTPKDKKHPNDMTGVTPLRICEVEEVEIEESFKKLIGTASVRFPRGTMYRKTITQATAKEDEAYKKVTAKLQNNGIVEESRSMTSMVTTDTFHIGDRIMIYLGYTDNPKIADLAKTSNTGRNIYNNSKAYNQYLEALDGKFKKHMSLMFNGYITKVSLDTPIELECENLASYLKTVTCSNQRLTKCAVKQLLGDGEGCLNLLENSGLKLHRDTANMNFDLGTIQLSSDLTVADVLMEWSKYGLFSYVADDDGEPAIKIARAYYTNPSPLDSLLMADKESSSKPIDIHFDYHVANNGLTLMSSDKNFLALEAQAIDKDDKFFHVTILRNADFDASKEESESNARYRFVNETKLSAKALKSGKRYVTSAPEDKVDMKLYTKISFISKKHPCTKEQLLEEAIKYFEGYNMNGIEGSLTLFGDLRLRTAQQVYLYDRRYPGKNGIYLVEEVHTTFGTNGFRQKIKLPYCIKREGNQQS